MESERRAQESADKGKGVAVGSGNRARVGIFESGAKKDHWEGTRVRAAFLSNVAGCALVVLGMVRDPN